MNIRRFPKIAVPPIVGYPPLSDTSNISRRSPSRSIPPDPGMAGLTHVAGWSADAWPKWAAHAAAFADAWMKAFLQGDEVMRAWAAVEGLRMDV